MGSNYTRTMQNFAVLCHVCENCAWCGEQAGFLCGVFLFCASCANTGLSKHKNMHPIALQNAVMKWMSSVILLQLQDVFAQITPPTPKKGFMKGRQMLEHVLQGRIQWEAQGELVIVAADFQKAYDSVSRCVCSSMGER